MSQQLSTPRTPLLYTPDAARPSSPFLLTLQPSLQPTTTILTPPYPASPPCHHTALSFPHPSAFHPAAHPHAQHPSTRWRTVSLTQRAVLTVVLCLLLALLVLLTCHVLAPSRDGLFAVLSRMRPHFGHAQHLLAAAQPPQLAAAAHGSPGQARWDQSSPLAGIRAMGSLPGAAQHSAERMAASHLAPAQPDTPTSPTSDTDTDTTTTATTRHHNHLAILASYLATPPTHRTTPPPNSAASPGFLVTATRFWCTEPGDLARLAGFVEGALAYSDVVLVGLNVEADECMTVEWLDRAGWGQSVHVVPVMPWLSVTAALNALLLYASRLSFSRILYQSVEITASVAAINILLSHLDHRTLVVGACLPPYHSCPTSPPAATAAYAAISGVNNPWNTLAVWHIPSLLKTGFLMVSDSGTQGGTEGQEEGPTIALLQWMARRWEDKAAATTSPSRDAADDSVAAAMRCEAKLVTLPAVSAVHWEAVEGSRRQAYVERKLRSKRQRYEEQMERLGIDHGVVRFVVEEDSNSEKDAMAARDGAGVADEAAANRRPIPIGH